MGVAGMQWREEGGGENLRSMGVPGHIFLVGFAGVWDFQMGVSLDFHIWKVVGGGWFTLGIPSWG